MVESVRPRSAITPHRPWCDPFFSQAEDGIRDYKVTGVQTCALPIYESEGWCLKQNPDAEFRVKFEASLASIRLSRRMKQRSEERRVGKECSSRRVQQL